MYEEVIIHAGTEQGGALCGKKEIAKREVLQAPYWDRVTCAACNEQRILIKTREDLDHANQILNRI
jgi:hypothetical protein